MTDHPPKSGKSAAKKPARWNRRPGARRREILDAALAVFADKGFYAAQMGEIGRRAGVTKGTLYLYFISKEEIFKTLVQESIGAQVAPLEKMAREFEGTTPDLIRLVVRTLVAFLRNNTRTVLPKLIIAETGNFPELARFYRSEVTDRILGIFEQIVRRGMERSEFREINSGHGGRLMYVPVMFIAIWSASFGLLDSVPYDYEGFIETHLEVILRGLAADKDR